MLVASNARAMGDDDEEAWGGAADGRYTHLMTDGSWRAACAAAGFVELESRRCPPDAPPEEQRWLASAWRRTGGE